MSKKIEELLLQHQSRLLADIAELEASDPSKDAFRDINNTDDDDAAESEDHARIHARIEASQDQLKDIKKALAKLEDGSYGKCQRCGKAIAEARLEAKPWAIYDIECEEIVESGRA